MGSSRSMDSEQDEKDSLSFDQSDLGSPDSLRYVVLISVLEERYDTAVETLEKYIEKPSEYPEYKAKISRYIKYSVDLVYAIRTKRNFPGIKSLTRTKQQELKDKFRAHFKELIITLKKVEKVQHDLKMVDVRATSYVVQALWYAFSGIVLLAFLLEIQRGMGQSFLIVMEDFMDKGAGGLSYFLNL